MKLTLSLLIAAILILLLCQPCNGFVDKSGWFEARISHYSCSEEQGTADGITASGCRVFEGCAASYPGEFEFGTKLFIAGIGIVEVWDTGTGPPSKEMWLDVYLESTEECFERGVVRRDVFVIEEGE